MHIHRIIFPIFLLFASTPFKGCDNNDTIISRITREASITLKQHDAANRALEIAQSATTLLEPNSTLNKLLHIGASLGEVAKMLGPVMGMIGPALSLIRMFVGEPENPMLIAINARFDEVNRKLNKLEQQLHDSVSEIKELIIVLAHSEARVDLITLNDTKNEYYDNQHKKGRLEKLETACGKITAVNAAVTYLNHFYQKLVEGLDVTITRQAFFDRFEYDLSKFRARAVLYFQDLSLALRLYYECQYILYEEDNSTMKESEKIYEKRYYKIVDELSKMDNEIINDFSKSQLERDIKSVHNKKPTAPVHEAAQSIQLYLTQKYFWLYWYVVVHIQRTMSFTSWAGITYDGNACHMAQANKTVKLSTHVVLLSWRQVMTCTDMPWTFQLPQEKFGRAGGSLYDFSYISDRVTAVIRYHTKEWYDYSYMYDYLIFNSFVHSYIQGDYIQGDSYIQGHYGINLLYTVWYPCLNGDYKTGWGLNESRGTTNIPWFSGYMAGSFWQGTVYATHILLIPVGLYPEKHNYYSLIGPDPYLYSDGKNNPTCTNKKFPAIQLTNAN